MTQQPPPHGPLGPAPTPPPPGFRPGPVPPPGPIGYAMPRNAYTAPPVYQPAPAPNTMAWTGAGYPVAATARPVAKHSSHTKVVGILVAALLVAVGAFVGISLLVTPGAQSTPPCPPTCPNPPVGQPVASPETFTAADGSFSVTYLPAGSRIHLTKSASSVDMKLFPPGETDEILLTGLAAKGDTADQVVASVTGKLVPDAKVAYVLPNAILGFQHGYGVVLDNYLQTTNGATEHDRIVVVGAVKNDVALLAIGVGPFREYSAKGLNDGHASGANSFAALLMDQMINSFTWKGDPPR